MTNSYLRRELLSYRLSINQWLIGTKLSMVIVELLFVVNNNDFMDIVWGNKNRAIGECVITLGGPKAHTLSYLMSDWLLALLEGQ